MSLRRFRLEEALDKVLRLTNLRRPQRESLEKVYGIIRNLGLDLEEIEPEELVTRVKDHYPTWSFGTRYPQMTFALATGVGKTRLMGAIIAFLYLSRQSKNFLILAPRAAILRKLKEECMPGSSKYLFVESSLVPTPNLYHSGNIGTFSPERPESGSFRQGPNIFILSPQSITGSDKLASRTSEFSGTSLVAHLSSLNDLIILMDEAHHLGKVAEKETKAWTQSIRELGPRLQFGMTATPRQEAGVNILHSYDLQQCLKEKLYTKDVRIIVRQKSDTESISDDDWDHITLDFALDRLKRKERALEDYQNSPPFPPIKPVMLVCAENTQHADKIGSWLVEQRGLGKGEILVTHSERSKSEQDIEKLVGIEKPNNKVKVVVNVFELTEGWDVTNVYVIAPLRRMGTFQGAIQTMGRGLRLPAGQRVDDEELDTLDVLCFGKESLEEVLDFALHEYGAEEDKETYVQVRESDDDELSRDQPTKTISISAIRPQEIEVPRAVRRPVEPDLDFDVSTLRKIAGRTAAEFDLVQGDVAGTEEEIKVPFDTFVRLTTSRVLAGLNYLSEPLHRDLIDRLVSTFIRTLGQKEHEPVALDWMQVATVMIDEIDGPYRKKGTVFELGEDVDKLSFGDYEWRVPPSCDSPKELKNVKDWDTSLFRIPIKGWKRCIYEGTAFDTAPEFQLAKVLDNAAIVDWWVRNDPPKLKIATPIGNYEPDFIIVRNIGGKKIITIIEVKRGDFWTPIDSNARVKARATDAWCEAQNRAGSIGWAHWVVLDTDVPTIKTVEEIERIRVNSD